jgi:hypothetical protein
LYSQHKYSRFYLHIRPTGPKSKLNFDSGQSIGNVDF